jgi:rhomboid family GlyGly-CTERM serine protease
LSDSNANLNGDPSNSAAIKRPSGLPVVSSQSWWLFGLISLVLVLLWAGGLSTQQALRYERAAIFNGQWWRLVTGHLVHFDFRHLILNLAGATVMVLLFAGAVSRRQLVWVLVASVAAIDAGFLLWMPQLEWYVGLSGVLHGVLAAGCVAWWRTAPLPLASALTLTLVGKLLWEQLHGSLPLAGEMPVVVNAHLFGAMGGGLCALGQWLVRKPTDGP